MKKLLVILFALGLVFSFTAPVMATDVSFDGTYRIRGFYDSNSALEENACPSAYYDQRFRLGTVFQVAEGLKVTTRFDAMDGTWGDGTLRGNPTNNIQFDKVYMTFVTPVGQIEAGVFSDGVWGTGFGDAETFSAKIQLKAPVGNWVFVLNTVKADEADKNTGVVTNPTNQNSDFDDDKYRAAVIYHDEGIQVGLLYNHYRYENYLNTMAGLDPAYAGFAAFYKDVTANALVPYVKLTMGDLYIESEFQWIDGAVNSRTPGVRDLDLEGLSLYLKGQYNLGSSYVGGLFAYVKGDDPNTANTSENALGMSNSGADWDPMLILFSDTCTTSLGSWGAPSTALASFGDRSMTGTSMNNGSIYQVFAGTAIDKLALKASLSMAKADEVVAGWDDSYGTEFDVTAAYKIYDNLTYSAGFGYLWAGDYCKAGVAANKIDDTYLLMNKLQVAF